MDYHSPPVLTDEFLWAIWASIMPDDLYLYWVGKYQPIEDEL